MSRRGDIVVVEIPYYNRPGGKERPAAAGPRPAVPLFVGDERVHPETTAPRDGDVLMVLTPMAGG